MGALLEVSHPVLELCGRFLRQYDRKIKRLESKLDQVHGRWLGPALMTFHIQLTWRNWLVTQLDVGETAWVNAPDFSHALNMFGVQNNLMSLPTVTNMPALLSLRTAPRAPAPV
jgi:hypothetical protein